jgi:hypothetical protein
MALRRMVAVVALIWLSMTSSVPVARTLPPSRDSASTAGLPSAMRLLHARQLVLRQRKEDRDGIDLRDHHDTGGLRRVHHVAGIDQTHAGDAVDGRTDVRVVQHQFGLLDLRLVRLHRAFELPDQHALVVGLLLRR